MKKIAITASLVLASIHAHSGTIKLNCGHEMNVSRTLDITEKKSGNYGYSHAATFKTSGKDQTTGMLGAVTYKMVGQFDLSTEFSGQEEPIIALVDSKDPLFQLIIKKPTNSKTAPIPAMQIDLRTESVTRFDCTFN